MVTSFILFKIVDKTVGLRVSKREEIEGLDTNEHGLSNLLVSHGTIDFSSFLKKTKIPKLYVITRGTVPPNPSELLNSSNFKTVIDFLKEKFDRIIIDGVPVNGLPDSLVMAKHVDRVILVCACGHTNIDELENSKKALEQIDANIAGVVVNKTQTTKRGKYSNYYE